MSRLRPNLSFANAIALIALFVSLGGTVYAATAIDGKAIKKGSIPGNRLKPGSLGTAQLNEGALATVPSAARAAQADRAAEAVKAGFATRAGLADRALKADEADRVTNAARAEKAKLADRATLAEETELLGGRKPDELVEACKGGGAIKASFSFDPTLPEAQRLIDPFSCSGQEILDFPVGDKQWRFVIQGLSGNLHTVVSPFGRNTGASVEPFAREPTTVQVELFKVNGQTAGQEKFSLVIF